MKTVTSLRLKFSLPKSCISFLWGVPAGVFHSLIVATLGSQAAFHGSVAVLALRLAERYPERVEGSQSLYRHNKGHLFACMQSRSTKPGQLPRIIFTSIILLLAGLPLMSQTGDAGFIQKQFEKYKEQTLQEKIFVHTDRSFYVAGEIIWFKVYCVNEDNSSLLSLSKVAYIEVLDKNQQPVMQAKIALKDGTGSGSIMLPADVHSGNYLFRAYTNWMKNFDPAFYFHQPLTVVNTVVADTLILQNTAENYEVQFFPEGGDMVNELKSKIAFRVTDNAGNGIDFTGVVADENNNTLLHFKPARYGIGSFSLTPQRNRHYKAIITTTTGKVVTQNLPDALNRGYVINVPVTDSEARLKINIQANTDSKFAYLFIHTAQQVTTEELLYFTNGSATFEIDKSRLGEGISHLTLFDQNRQPVCERLYFKRPSQQLLIDGKTDASEYFPRKKVSIDLASTDEGNNADPADLSMAVFLIDSSAVNYEDIYSYLWMSSELKGRVESPEYYLSGNDTKVNEALDNLLLTHGWRRFKWSEALQDKKPVLQFLPEYEGHIVTGTIVSKANESPAPGVAAFLSVPGRNFKLYTSKSSSSGTVNFSTKDFYGTRLMVSMLNATDTAFYRVDLSNPFSENFSAEKIPPFNPASAESFNLLRRSINMQVQNIYAGTNLHVFENNKTDTFNFYGKADVKYQLDDYTRFPTMEEVLTEYVREINIRKRQDKFVLTMVSKDENAVASIKNPVILLDGVPQFDYGNKISNYDPLKVERLEIINDPYYMGTARLDGIASFFTYNGNLEGFQLDSSATVLDYEALQLRREFYSPSYETTARAGSRVPDFRSLLYWSPDIKTDEKGKKEIEFYTSDRAGKYAVVVQGFSKKGKAGSKVLMLDVKKDPLRAK